MLKLTSFVEEFSRVFSAERDVARNGTEQLDDVREVVFVARVVLTRVRLEQVVARRELEYLRKKYTIRHRIINTHSNNQCNDSYVTTMQAVLHMSAGVP